MPSKNLYSSSSSSSSSESNGDAGKMASTDAVESSHRTSSSSADDSPSFYSDHQPPAKRLSFLTPPRSHSPSTTSLPSNTMKDTSDIPASGNGTPSRRDRRVWTEEREVGLLNGIVAHVRDGRSLSDADALLEFIRMSLNMDLSKSQLLDKVRKLRAQYERNAKKEENPAFDGTHQERIYRLCKKIWGNDESNGHEDEDERCITANGNEEVPPELKESSLVGAEQSDFRWLFEGQESLYDNYARGRLPGVDTSALKRLEERDAKLRVRMLKLQLKQLEYERELLHFSLAGIEATMK